MLKVYRHGPITKNLAIFLILSLFYLHVLNSLARGVTAFDVDTYWVFLESNKVILGFFVASLVSLIFYLRFSIVFFRIFYILILGQSIFLFLQNFDKIILVLCFIFLVIGYYLNLLWVMEREEAMYCPGFYNSFIRMENGNSTTVNVKWKSGEAYGSLSNWDETGAFIYFKDNKTNPRGKLTLFFKFEGKTFYSNAKVVTRYGNGYGVKILSTKSEYYDWKDLLNVLFDRGYQPLIGKG